ELIAAVTHATFVAQQLAGLDAQQDIVSLSVTLLQVMRVASRHQRQAETVGDVNRPLAAQLLNLQAVVLDFDVEVRPKEPGEPLSEFRRLIGLILEDELTELARRTAAQTDQAVLVALQQFLVDPRDVVIALQVSGGGHLDQVLEAGRVLGQERQVVARVATPSRVAFAAFARGDVRLVADDGVDARLFAAAIELNGPIEIAVIGQGDGVHALFFDVRDQLGNPVGPVEQAVVTMAMQVDKWLGHMTRQYEAESKKKSARPRTRARNV